MWKNLWEQMRERVRTFISSAIAYIRTFEKWLLFGCMAGIVCGLVGTAFAYAVHSANEIREERPWLLYLLPIGGLLISGAYSLLKMKKDKGTNLVFSTVQEEASIPLQMPVLIFFGTFVTHLFGGSAGREGAALQIGGGIGSQLSKMFKFDNQDTRIMIVCSMSAVFSALFGTPLTAVVFTMEVIHVGIFHYSALFPSLVSSSIAYAVSRMLAAPEEKYVITDYPVLSIPTAFRVAVLAVLLALVSILFCEVMHKTASLASKYFKNLYLKSLVGAALIIGMTFLVGSQRYNGAGGSLIIDAVSGAEPIYWYDFLLKLLFTAITIGFGFKGGEIVPSFFVGATFGAVMGPLLGLPAGFSAAIGMVGVFCGAVNSPLASIILSVELFGSQNLLLFALVCSISFLLSGSYSLYSSQTLVHSKLRPESLSTGDNPR